MCSFEKKNSQIVTQEISYILTTSKRSPLRLESDRGSEVFNNIFQNFSKFKNIQQYSSFTNKGPSICERLIRTIKNLMKKAVFQKENADWFSELHFVIIKYNNTIHHNIRMTPTKFSEKANEKEVYSNLQVRRVRLKPNFKLWDLVRTADIKRVFSKSLSTNWSNKIYTITEVIHHTILWYRIRYLPERYIENLLGSTKLSLDENDKVLKELTSVQ